MIDSGTILRVARPTDHLAEVVRFYTEGLGLSWLEAFEDHEGFDGVMLGVPGAGYHIEITRKRGTGRGRRLPRMTCWCSKFRSQLASRWGFGRLRSTRWAEPDVLAAMRMST
jgi:hypothetical protein